MEEVMRIVDGDLESLEDRLRRAMDDGAECIVARFTYWYTSRPPVHEAVVLRDVTSLERAKPLQVPL
jgi:hypothetical protein